MQSAKFRNMATGSIGFSVQFELAIPRSLLRGHLIEGRVRETAGFSVEQSSFIPRQLAAGY
jgi:hypothetical protein